MHARRGAAVAAKIWQHRFARRIAQWRRCIVIEVNHQLFLLLLFFLLLMLVLVNVSAALRTAKRLQDLAVFTHQVHLLSSQAGVFASAQPQLPSLRNIQASSAEHSL